MELAAEVGIRRFGDLGFSVDSHRQLVDAIASQDVERARDVLAEMVGRNRAAVLGLYALGPPASETVGEAYAAAPRHTVSSCS